MDLLEPIAVAVMGISEERCGLRQASILASPRLYEGMPLFYPPFFTLLLVLTPIITVSQGAWRMWTNT